MRGTRKGRMILKEEIANKEWKNRFIFVYEKNVQKIRNTTATGKLRPFSNRDVELVGLYDTKYEVQNAKPKLR